MARTKDPIGTKWAAKPNQRVTKTRTKAKAPQFSTLTREHDIVVVAVGPEYTKFNIHGPLLAHHSDYFRGALNGSWKEGDERKVVLEDVEVGIFNVFVHWLYSQNLPPTDRAWLKMTEVEEVDQRRHAQSDQERIKAIVFADRFLVPGFRKAVKIDLVDRTCVYESNCCYPGIIYAFEHLRSDDPLLDFLVDVQCAFLDAERDKAYLRSELPNEFLIRVMLRYSKVLQKPELQVLDWCSYHEHGFDEEKRVC